jgi:hypothetical protein
MESDFYDQQIERTVYGSHQEATQARDFLNNGGQVAVEAILRGLKHPNPRFRAACCGMLDHLGERWEACFYLAVKPLLSDPVPGVRRAAIHVVCCEICHAPSGSVDLIPEVIARLLTDPTVGVRRVAARHLRSDLSDPRVVKAFKIVLQSETDEQVKSYARRGLGLKP